MNIIEKKLSEAGLVEFMSENGVDRLDMGFDANNNFGFTAVMAGTISVAPITAEVKGDIARCGFMPWSKGLQEEQEATETVNVAVEVVEAPEAPVELEEGIIDEEEAEKLEAKKIKGLKKIIKDEKLGIRVSPAYTSEEIEAKIRHKRAELTPKAPEVKEAPEAPKADVPSAPEAPTEDDVPPAPEAPTLEEVRTADGWSYSDLTGSGWSHAQIVKQYPELDGQEEIVTPA